MAEATRCYWKDMWQNLYHMRNYGQLCDLTIISGDDDMFKAHASVIAASSNLIHQHILNQEASPLIHDISPSQLKIPRIRSDELRITIDFIYGVLPNNVTDFEKLKCGTSLLQIPGAAAFCNERMRQLKEEMNVTENVAKLLCPFSNESQEQNINDGLQITPSAKRPKSLPSLKDISNFNQVEMSGNLSDKSLKYMAAIGGEEPENLMLSARGVQGREEFVANDECEDTLPSDHAMLTLEDMRYSTQCPHLQKLTKDAGFHIIDSPTVEDHSFSSQVNNPDSSFNHTGEPETKKYISSDVESGKEGEHADSQICNASGLDIQFRDRDNSSERISPSKRLSIVSEQEYSLPLRKRSKFKTELLGNCSTELLTANPQDSIAVDLLDVKLPSEGGGACLLDTLKPDGTNTMPENMDSRSFSKCPFMSSNMDVSKVDISLLPQISDKSFSDSMEFSEECNESRELTSGASHLTDNMVLEAENIVNNEKHNEEEDACCVSGRIQPVIISPCVSSNSETVFSQMKNTTTSVISPLTQALVGPVKNWSLIETVTSLPQVNISKTQVSSSTSSSTASLSSSSASSLTELLTSCRVDRSSSSRCIPTPPVTTMPPFVPSHHYQNTDSTSSSTPELLYRLTCAPPYNNTQQFTARNHIKQEAFGATSTATKQSFQPAPSGNEIPSQQNGTESRAQIFHNEEEEEEEETAGTNASISSQHDENAPIVEQLNLMMKDKSYRCLECSYSNKHIALTQMHMYQKHKRGTPHIHCKHCDKAFFSTSQQKAHMRRSHADGVSSSSTSSSLPSSTCADCAQSFDSTYKLQTHQIKAHSKGKLFSCDHCTFKSPRKKDVQAHLLSQHSISPKGVRVFECVTCGYRCIDRNRFEEHEAKHTGIGKYACPLCDKTYTTRRGMRTHQMYHSKERPHACSICAASFKVRSKLKDHIRLVHTSPGVKPYQCGYCSHRTALRGNCNQHIKKYHPGKPIEVIDELADTRKYVKEYDYAQIDGDGIQHVNDVTAVHWADKR